MDNRRDLNYETTRTLRKNLGIPVKVCSAINRYKRKKGKFKHIDELWRIPGMTRKLFEQVKDKYVVAGQQAPASGQIAPFVEEWTSLSRSTGLDSRSFPSLRKDWKKFKQKSPKPGPSGVVEEKYMLARVQVTPSSSANVFQSDSNVNEKEVVSNARKSPSPVKEPSSNSVIPHRPDNVNAASLHMPDMKPIQMPQVFATQGRLLVPINVQQSESGNKLCIIYSCSPQGPHTDTKRQPTPKKSPGMSNAIKPSKPNSPISPRSKSPSILKRPSAGHGRKSLSKSQLEESRDSPTRDKRVGFQVREQSKAVSASGSYCSAKEEPMTETVAQTSRVYRQKDGITTETITERFQTIGGPSTSRAVESTVGSGEKVSEWINSNSDFMKAPEMAAWGPEDVIPRPKLIDGKDVRKLQTVARGRIPLTHGSPEKDNEQPLPRHRRKPPGIDTKGLHVQHRTQSPGGRSRNRSPTKSWSEERAQIDQTKQYVDPHHGRKRKATERSPQKSRELPKGYTYRRKSYRREKSREKTVVLPKRKHDKGRGNTEGKSSQPCIVI